MVFFSTMRLGSAFGFSVHPNISQVISKRMKIKRRRTRKFFRRFHFIINLLQPIYINNRISIHRPNKTAGQTIIRFVLQLYMLDDSQTSNYVRDKMVCTFTERSEWKTVQNVRKEAYSFFLEHKGFRKHNLRYE